MENLKSKEFGETDIVTYEGESWVIVDIEEDFVSIRNVMDHTKTIRVPKEDVIPGGGYGDTNKNDPNLESTVVEYIADLNEEEKKLVEKITKKTLGGASDSSHPSA